MNQLFNFHSYKQNFSLLIITIIFGSIISFTQYNLIKNELIQDYELENIHMHKAYNLNFEKLKNELTFNSNKIINIDGLKEAFYNKDRKKVLSLAEDYYQEMISLNKYLKIVTFRLPDGSTFLRVHKPEMYNDKLNKKRKIILDTINTKKRQFGFEVGKLKMTYRVVSPIYFQKEFLGVMEIGVEPEYLTENLYNIFNTKMALLVKKEDLDINISNITTKDIQNYAFVRGDRLFRNQVQNINLNNKYSKVSFENNDYYINTSFNLNDNKNNIAAKLLIAYNLENYNNKLSKLIYINLIITITLFLVLLFGFNFFTRRIRKSHDIIRKKDDILATQSKMASMGEMLESIAHQWRQPLSIITTSATGLKFKKEFGTLKDDELISYLDSINDASQHLSQTIEDFRSFYKQDKQTNRFRIKQAIEKSINLISSQLKNKDIEITLDIDNSIAVGYENETIQVFLNILNNAKDAFDDLKLKDKCIQISLKKEQNKVLIYFQDNAGGIPEEILPKVFNHKFTTKINNDGTGIGLYMSKLIIQKSHGKISVRNQKFKYKNKIYYGACFTIELPTK